MKKSIPFLILGFLLTITTGTIKADFITVKDTIMADVTWSVDTVKVIGSVVLLDDVTLTINPGTRVEFQGYYYLYIQGTILAVGTAVDSIVFTAADTNGFYNHDVKDGSWNGILFYNAVGYGGANGAMIDNDTSRFDYCIIEYTKAHPSSELVWSAIEVGVFSRLVISRCEIRNNYSHYKGGAIRVFAGSDIIIANNYIHHNLAMKAGGGIYSNNSTPVITGNIITHNSTLSKEDMYGKGGGISIEGYNPVIRNNTISYNSAQFGAGIFMSNGFSLVEFNTIAYNTCYKGAPDGYSIGGGILMEQTSTPLIRSNKIANNRADEAGGIYSMVSKPEIVNNLIVNNIGDSSGGAFYGWDSEVLFLNNTMAHNQSKYAGAFGLTNTKAMFINNVVWNNGNNQIHLQDTYTELDIVNSIIHGGTSIIGGVGSYKAEVLIEDGPEFMSPSAGVGTGFDGLSGNWSVPVSSPCVNAGITDVEGLKLPVRDLQGNDRINHNVIDIGAYEVLVPYISFSDTIKSDTTWIADTVKITGNIVVNDDVILTILPGTIVEFQDTFHLQVNGTLLAVGLPQNMIRFTVVDTAGFYMPTTPDGGWQGIIFDNSYDGMNNAMKDNDTSVLSFCHFSYAKYPATSDNGGTIILRYFDGLIINNCIFSHNKSYWGTGGINLDRSDISIENCAFEQNWAEDGAAMKIWTSEVRILNCHFEENYSRGPGGAIRLYASTVSIENCKFIRNVSEYRGGAYYSSQTETMIRNSLFANNNASNHGGAISTENETLHLINNIIVNNSSPNAGGGIYCRYADDLLTVNNTIAYNYANNGGGMYTVFSNHRSVNDILYGNDAANKGKQYMVHSVTASLEFRNGLYEGGPENFGFYIGQELTGSFMDLIDTIPWFVNPSGGAGSDSNGVNSDWSLFPVSPCINSGTSDNDGYKVPLMDFASNPRIFDTEIDMGAYENQYGLPVITMQPKNQILCEGDSLMLEVRTETRSNFQWQKDGQDIPGADKHELKIQSASVQDDGNYQCIVSNTFGTVSSNSAYLIARAAPEIIRQPEDIWAIEGEKTIISSTDIGTQPIHFQWYKNSIMIPGKTYPDLWIFDTDSTDEGRYYCKVINACSTIQSDTVQLYIAPQICMVTVDTSTGDNLVIWEKKTTAPIASYNVYRESIVAGEYDAIGNVPASTLSVYSDTVANPAVQAYIYKITAATADGQESDIGLCRPHKTIHLLTSLNTEYNTAQLDWDHYYGFDYGTFYIFRSTGQTGFSNIHAMASSTTTWLDVDASSGEAYFYRVAVEKLDPCNPTGSGKAGTGPYHHSLSNLDDNKMQVTGLDNIETGTLKIYPNPFTERTTVEFPNPGLSEYRVTVWDISGKAVITDLISGNRLVIERGDLKAGLYSIELAGQRIYRDRFVVK